MRTVWLNFGAAAVWWVFGWDAAAWLVPMSVVVFVYSMSHDWHHDAAAYRAALADPDSNS